MSRANEIDSCPPGHLNLVHFPPHSPLPVADLPSMSLSQKLHFLIATCFYDADPISSIDTRSLATFAVEFYLACAFEDEIKLLCDLVVVPLCPASRRDTRFRKALVLDGRIRAIENRTNSRTVFRDKRGLSR